MGGYGLGGTSAGGSVAALMRRQSPPAEALLITRNWQPPLRSPRSPRKQD